MTENKESRLVVATAENISKDIIDMKNIDEGLMDQKAQEYADKLTDFKSSSIDLEKHQNSVETIGRDVQLESSSRLKLLKQPLKKT